jgi:protein HIRA/HIR1
MVWLFLRYFSSFIDSLSHRSPDGLALYAVSSDGMLACMSFTSTELSGRASPSAQVQYLRKFGFEPPALPAGFVHPSDAPTTDHPAPTPVPRQQEVVNRLVAKRKPKRGTLTSIPSAAVPSAARVPPSTTGASVVQRQAALASSKLPQSVTTDGFGFDDAPMEQDPPPPISRRVAQNTDYSRPGSRGGDFDAGNSGFRGGDGDVRIDSLESDSPLRTRREDSISARPTRARTLGGDRVREAIPVRELVTGGNAMSGSTPGGNPYHAAPQVVLEVPAVLTYISAKGSGDVLLEGKNEETGAYISYLDMSNNSNACVASRSKRSWPCSRQTNRMA